MSLPFLLLAATATDRNPLVPQTNTVNVGGVVFLVLLVALVVTLFVRLARIERNTRPE